MKRKFNEDWLTVWLGSILIAPLLPIENKLILWSVLLGLFLPGALVGLNQLLFR